MKNKISIIGILIGAVVFGGLNYIVADELTAKDYTFDKNKLYENKGITTNAETVEAALDELYAKYEAKKALAPNGRYLDGTIVYYNPLLDRGCTESEWNSDNLSESDGISRIPNSATGYVGDATNDTTKAGSCMRWFAYQDSNNSDTVHLLLDHNTTATKQWWTSKVYKTFYESQLYTTDLPNLINNSKWNVELEVDPSGSTTQTSGVTILTLLDANDVAKIINWKDIRNSDWDSTNTRNYFYFETGTTSTKVYTSSSYYSPYWWLYDRTGYGSIYPCTSYGCKTADSSNYGYWTKTNVGSGSTVWVVDYRGHLSSSYANDTSRGVRPVVIVDKSKL